MCVFVFFLFLDFMIHVFLFLFLYLVTHAGLLLFLDFVTHELGTVKNLNSLLDNYISNVFFLVFTQINAQRSLIREHAT